MAMLLITHDLGIVRRMDRAGLRHAARAMIVEEGKTEEIFNDAEASLYAAAARRRAQGQAAAV